MDMRVRILIADDHPGMLDWMTLNLREEFEIVATARNGVAALHGVQQHQPDVLVLDVAMSPMNGFEVMKSLQRTQAKTAVVLVTTYTNAELERAALSAGARAVIMKCKLADELIPAIRNAVGRGVHPC
jgi:DNA-binding NarL/FixJ family response regulator